MEVGTCIRAKPYDIAGVGRDFGFEQDYMKHGESWCAEEFVDRILRNAVC